MRTSFWKATAVLALALMLLFSSFALGEARYPALGGVVTDDANALSQTMAADMATYAKKLADNTQVQLHVALVLFLDGETVQTYADTLFTRWKLGENDLLVVGAAAEDTFAIVSGTGVKAKLSDASLKGLLYSSGFSDAFKTQRYDAAFGSLFVALNDLVGKQYGAQIALGELFRAYQPDANPQTVTPATTPQDSLQSAMNTVVDTTSQIWAKTMNSITSSVQDYKQYDSSKDESGGGLTPGGWIVLAVIVLIIFGQSEPARRARRGGGCGCSPIGWIVGGLGLGALFGRRRDDARHNDREWRRNERDGCRRGPCGFGRPPRW